MLSSLQNNMDITKFYKNSQSSSNNINTPFKKQIIELIEDFKSQPYIYTAILVVILYSLNKNNYY